MEQARIEANEPTGSLAVLQLLWRLEEKRSLDIEEMRLKVALEAELKVSIQTSPKRLKWHWTPKEDRAILAFISSRQGIVYGRRKSALVGKPFEKDDAVRKLAAQLGRSEWAVYRRMERLRKERKCSNATGKQGG